VSVPGHLDGANPSSETAPPIPSTFLTESSLQFFGSNYLDGVSLPLFDTQPAFYPGLSLNDPLLLSPVDVDFRGTNGNDMDPGKNLDSNANLPGRLSRLGSCSPGPQPEAAHIYQHSSSFTRISQENWVWLSNEVAQFQSVLPSQYELPSRHAMTRYLHGFMNGFHPHFPILHPPTLSIRRMAPELIVALAAVGSQYCLEQHQGLKLFHVARAIALERVHARDSVKEQCYTFQGPADCFSTPPNSATEHTTGMHQSWSSRGDYACVETIQALFFLMAMATWGGRESVVGPSCHRNSKCSCHASPPRWAV
jgi:hypothetical protein